MYNCDSSEFLSKRVTQKHCPLCDASAQECKTIFTKNGFPIIRCDSCETDFVGQIPSNEELTKAYGEGYYNGDIYVDYESQSEGRRNHYSKLLESLSKHIPIGGKILELGAATGDFLDVAKTKGMKTVGVEISNYSSEIAAQKGHTVFSGTLEENIDNVRERGPYDAVFLHDVFEHLVDPKRVLQILSGVTSKNGILYLNTLNIDSPTVKHLGEKWSQYVPPFHLVYPTKKSLKLALDQSGFALISQVTKGPLYYDVGRSKIWIALHIILKQVVRYKGWGYAQNIVAKKR